MIDLRSDTVTNPSKEMLDFMFQAKLGDDVFEEDSTVNELQEYAASLFGKEASLYCSSGTQTNQIAINLHVNPGGEVICHKDSHVYKYEGGVHRVQRIPKTESGGRVHTSAATVAVLPEAETAEVEINDSDIKIDTYRASGAGGQHVNKTESAIRLTHIPTGLVVTCQDESSQHKNKASAMKVLRSRLFALEQEKLNKDRDEMRKSIVSTGDRSAKIRTYNFPQGRITDHRINYTTHKLQVTLEGELDHLIEQLKLAEDSAKIE